MQDVNDFALVDECFYMDSACGAELKDEYKKFESFIYKYLNSKLATYVYRKITVPKANGYVIYKNAFLKNLLVPLPDDNTDFSKMHKDIFEKYLCEYLQLDRHEIEEIYGNDILSD